MVFCNLAFVQVFEMYQCHNPYFNRWFSAMLLQKIDEADKKGHNPYFNRWFSAINIESLYAFFDDESQSLF